MKIYNNSFMLNLSAPHHLSGNSSLDIRVERKNSGAYSCRAEPLSLECGDAVSKDLFIQIACIDCVFIHYDKL